MPADVKHTPNTRRDASCSSSITVVFCGEVEHDTDGDGYVVDNWIFLLLDLEILHSIKISLIVCRKYTDVKKFNKDRLRVHTPEKYDN